MSTVLLLLIKRLCVLETYLLFLTLAKGEPQQHTWPCILL